MLIVNPHQLDIKDFLLLNYDLRFFLKYLYQFKQYFPIINFNKIQEATRKLNIIDINYANLQNCFVDTNLYLEMLVEL